MVTFVFFRSENEGAADKNIDFGLQVNIAIEVVKVMFTEVNGKYLQRMNISCFVQSGNPVLINQYSLVSDSYTKAFTAYPFQDTTGW